MTKEKNSVVGAVKEVVGSIKLKEQNGELLTKYDIDNLVKVIENLITDYETTIENYNENNSLVVKYEKFIEVVGIIEYISVENTDVLDKSLNCLNSIINSAKQK